MTLPKTQSLQSLIIQNMNRCQSLKKFEQFIDQEFNNHLVNETCRYALFINWADPNITAIAILFISGYNNLPSKRHYWDSNDDMRNYAVSQSMPRDRFLQICRFLHFPDNTEMDPNDKAWKIRPLMEIWWRVWWNTLDDTTVNSLFGANLLDSVTKCGAWT